MLRIGIIGTRGIPNHYGGFEQLAQHLSAGLVKKGFEVSVYNSHNHPYTADQWNGVNIIHCYDPEYIAGTVGQFGYDLNCTIDARRRKFDILLILGYTSSSVWGWLYPGKTVCINHMDGHEWERQKYNGITRHFLKYAEKLAIRFSQFYISDALAIREYLREKYAVDSAYITYGADITYAENGDPDVVSKEPYYLLIARMEKENNIEMILDGMRLSNSPNRFLVIGNTQNRFGRYLVNKYRDDPRIQFKGSIYDQSLTGKLKRNCVLYFHGHSVGGTNPSLLEAMASGAIVCANDNVFNRDILQDGGYYFSSAGGVKTLMESVLLPQNRAKMRQQNLTRTRELFNWPAIINSYESFIVDCYKQKNT